LIENKYIKKFSIIMIISILVFSSSNLSKRVNSNPIPVSNFLEIGGLLPSNTSFDLQMQQANVSMDINALGHPAHFIVEFYGSYDFYNPNETIELTIGAPFITDPFFNGFSYINNIEPSMKILVNGIKINHTYSYFQNLEGWDDYIDNYQFYRTFAIANVTFTGDDVTNLEYSWQSELNTLDNTQSLAFYYDVATGRAWSGNIMEKVTMSVIGKQPDYYTDYQHGLLSKNCVIDNISGGKNYSWTWENEEITDFYVGIEYEFNILDTDFSGISIFLGIVTFGIVVYFLKKDSRKGKKRNFENRCWDYL